MRRALAVLLFLAACNQKTGLLIEVEGPDGTSSVAAGVATLHLVVARASYCGRQVATLGAGSLSFSVAGRDLTKKPASILVEPDHETDLRRSVDPIVLALDASGRLLGAAEFGPEKFVYKEVLEQKLPLRLYADGASDLAPDGGCVCAPGLPLVGDGSGQGCDARIPPSFDALENTAGCELPAGAALPLGVCDGQTYPGEQPDRTLPCYATVDGACRIGTRTCVDEGGVAYADACAPDATAGALPTSALCDAYATCEGTTCADPLACERQATTVTHHAVTCTLPVSPTGIGGDMGGGASPCDGPQDWVVPFGASAGATCAEAILDGTQVGPFTLGWQAAGQTGAQVTSTQCPPTFEIDAIGADPSALPATQVFSVSVNDTIYDVTLEVSVGCSGAAGDAGRKLRCTGL